MIKSSCSTYFPKSEKTNQTSEYLLDDFHLFIQLIKKVFMALLKRMKQCLASSPKLSELDLCPVQR